MVSWRLGHVAVVFGIVVAGNGVQGVLLLLLLPLCSDILETCEEEYVRCGFKMLQGLIEALVRRETDLRDAQGRRWPRKEGVLRGKTRILARY